MNIFTKHPNDVDETYFQHLKYAFKISILLILAGVACLIHSFLPFLFEHTMTNLVSKADDIMYDRYQKKYEESL